MEPKFSDSKFEWVTDLRVTRTGSDHEVDWVAYSESRKTYLEPNLKHCKGEIIRNYDMKFFVMDSDDTVLLKNNIRLFGNRPEVIVSVIQSLTVCSRQREKKLYVRLVGTANDPHVFCGDVLELIPILLDHQGAANGFCEKQKLEKYQKKWKSADDFVYKTISLKKFDEILEEFDCDKSLLILHADTTLAVMAEVAVERGSLVTTWAQDCVNVADVPTAIRFIFETVVKSVNWQKERCVVHDYCHKQLKDEIIKAMRKLMNYGGSYIKLRFVMEMIQKIKFMCIPTYDDQNYVPDHLFLNFDNPEEMDMRAYLRPAEFFDLPVYTNFLGNRLKKRAWMCRFYVEVGWLESFFTPGKCDGIRDMIASNLLHIVPSMYREKAKLFMAETFAATLAKARAERAKQNEKKSGNVSQPKSK
ncbi:unnamed protein product [Caenorhabditis brenneri]